MIAPETTWFESRPKGTILLVTTASGGHFEIEAEGGAFRDFILHAGSPPHGFGGRTSSRGGARVFWSCSMLARWVAQGRCRIALVIDGGAQ